MPPTLLILIMLVVVLVPAGGLVLLGIVRLASASDPLLSDRLHTYAVVPEAQAQVVRGRRRSTLARMRVRLNAMLSAVGSESLALELARAHWPLSVPEYILIRLGSTLVAFLVGWFLARS